MKSQDKQTDIFAKICVSGWKLKVNKRFPANLSGELHEKCVFDNVRGPFEEITASEFAKTYKCYIGFSGRSQAVYIKHYLHRSWLDFAKHIFRKGRAQRAFDASLMLNNNSLNAPEVIALGRRGFGSIVLKSFLVTKEITDGKPIYQYINDNLNGSINWPPHIRHQFARQLGDVIGRMHSAYIFHGDLRAGNVFATSEKGNWIFSLIDNERTRKFLYLPFRLRLKNLVQINMMPTGISRADRMRFFKEYIKHNPQFKNKQKSLLKKVIAKTAHRLKGKDWA